MPVSAVIPVHNGEPYLDQAIDSVIAQGNPVGQIIVVDDGSTDGTRRVAKGYGDRVHYLFQDNAGAAAARNRGVEAVTSPLLAFLDADDLWTEGRLRRMLEPLEKDPTLDMVMGQTEQFFCPTLDEQDRRRLKEIPPITAGYAAGAMLVRRDSFLRVGLFDTTLRIGEFIAWFVQAKQASLRIAVTDDVVLRRRLHRTNLMLRSRGAYGDYLRIVKAKLTADRARNRDTSTEHKSTSKDNK
jgi:glycosyltransferase involved in cell wall biosynthesis